MDATLQTMMRETPLEVLTRAASFVAGRHSPNSTSPTGKKSLKRSVSGDHRFQENVALKLTNKCRRVGESESPVQTEDNISGDEEKSLSDDGGRRSASTQTAFSSFVPYSGYLPFQPTDAAVHRDSILDEEPCLILDLDQHTVKPSLPYNVTASTPGARTHSFKVQFETSSAPLNLSVSLPSRCSGTSSYLPMTSLSSNWPVSSSNQLSRTSQGMMSFHDEGALPMSSWRTDHDRQGFWRPKAELTHPPRPLTSTCHESSPTLSTGLGQRRLQHVQPDNGGPCNYTSVETDSNIDEHFRRSLGNNYPRVVPVESQNTFADLTTSHQMRPVRGQNAPTTTVLSNNDSFQPVLTNKSITGAIDEHFAKSLGSTWVKLKSETVGGCGTRPTENASAVDDHFAKALGDTWFKLKGDKRSS